MASGNLNALEILRLSNSLNDNSRELSNSLVAAVSNLISGISVSSILQSESLLANGTSRLLSHSRNTMSSISDIRALEHQTLKVPYELLNKKFRIAQKNIDREGSHVQSSINELEKAVNTKPSEESSQNEPVTVGKINELLIGVVGRLNVLKRKSFECISEEIDAVNVCKRRLEHLKEYCSKVTPEPPSVHEPTDPWLATWKRQRMDRMIVDHCLRSGFYDTAIHLAKCSKIEPLTNIDIFLVCRDIEDSLANHETSRCLTWCHDNRSKLRKVKSTLEFSLRQQEFIELVRADQRMEAVKYAQKYFSTFEEIVGTPAQTELEKVMGLLACTPDTKVERYRILFDAKRWQRLVEQFRAENFRLYQLTNASIFSITLQAGLSSLKTPQCYRKDATARNNECPVCSELLNKLAATLPCAHCSQSRLVCYISGDAMNEHNQPLMLPNGYVYGEKALKKMSLENGNKVICPRTGNQYDFKEVEKVFVM
ncbi:PREDICTED: macrophage erythroblast attacher-like [Rhagoletis zephyria]|uniref:macrophage erythroblast attacher-like n=1 Tax=Rhagoletis zephyria TaxID=28612 RepID=UPI000811A2F1|nr:PREDICTED: macrophage erythroblast attacher-like [Rhagoletis zephyria]KAH9405081.1 hypothetical protein TYRP_000918 [Tyrophagus putrescentiae]